MAEWFPFSKADLRDRDQRTTLFVSLSQCATTFSFNFVNIFMPFYIFRVSPYSYRITLLWVGAIVGIAGFCTTFTSPFWGSLTHRFSPKKLFQRGQLSGAIVFVLMGFTTDLHLLLLLRIIQGAMSGVSTIGLILVSSSSAKERLPANIGLFQSFLTLGQLIGPPLGTLAAAAIGYRGAFLCGSTLLFSSFLFCQFMVTDVPKLPKAVKPEIKESVDRRVPVGWFVCFIVQIHVMFLPSILPNVLSSFHIEGPTALKLAGLIVMLYSITTMVGMFTWTHLTRKIGIFRLVTFLLVMGVIFQALLSFTGGVVGFTLVRMLQTGLVAASIPLVISLFAGQQKGTVLGLLNSSRFAGNATGPMLAAYVLSVSNLPTLYLIISGLTIIALVGFRLVFRSEQTVTGTRDHIFP